VNQIHMQSSATSAPIQRNYMNQPWKSSCQLCQEFKNSLII